MNVRDIKHLATNGITEGSFGRLLNNEEELMILLIDSVKNGDYLWKEAEQLIKKYSFDNTRNNHTYFLSSIDRGYKGITFYVRERNYKGYRFVIKYKGQNYLIFSLKNGEIQDISIAFRKFHSGSSHSSLENIDSLESITKETREMFIKDKREAMTHYNKEIKDIKQDYKRVLKEYNECIKPFKEEK